MAAYFNISVDLLKDKTRKKEVVTARQVAYQSKDGTTVRMLVISSGDAPAGPRPTILYGYGGFDISLTPAYSPNILAWVSAGGVYAVANLRGGVESISRFSDEELDKLFNWQ